MNNQPALCIVFLHHIDDAVTRFHHRLIRHHNPNVPVVPLTFNRGIRNAVQLTVALPYHRRAEWRNIDQLVYHWFRSRLRIPAKRYLIIESDTHCASSAESFYESVWDEQASGAAVRTSVTHPRLWVFREVLNSAAISPHLTAISPLSGILLSEETLSILSQLAAQDLYKNLFCETRVGTILQKAGIKPCTISPNIETFISWAKRVPTGPGIWHSVKRRYPSNILAPNFNDLR